MRRIAPLLCLILLVPLLNVPGVSSTSSVQATQDIMIEDFSDIVTTTDLGLNDFSGNMGSLNGQYVTDYGPYCPSGVPPCALQIRWDFADATEDYTGFFMSLFGLTDTLVVTSTDSIPKSLAFPEHSLDLDRIDGVVNADKAGRAVRELCFAMTYPDGEPLRLKAELKDTAGGLRTRYFTFNPSQSTQSFCWDFRTNYTSGNPDLDLHQAKALSFIIERQNIGAGIQNPRIGTLQIERVWFTSDQLEAQPVSDEELLDLLELRAYQYFADWSSRKDTSAGVPQDRSTFGDLLTVGGIGFALPAHIIAAERGWVSRDYARTQVLSVLKLLDNPAAFGPEPVGKIGYKGWFYHFLGFDGTRKQNFDFPDTERNEALNTVELSSIDTGLALMGVLAAQSYFTGSEPEEVEIRTRAQAIYDRVDWNFMLESESQQFYLGWKPNEAYEGPPFAVPDQDGLGTYSGYITDTQTLDFYTDEALILILLALGATDEPEISPEIYPALERQCDTDLIRTYPAALFTYQFLPAFVDTRPIWTITPCDGTITWFDNTRVAIWRAIAYAEQNPRGYATYGPHAWGLSAAEGPFDDYHAYGAPTNAAFNSAEEDGTITYYGMVSAVSMGADLRTRVIAATRHAWARGDWHPRFGLPDAFNDDIAQAEPPDEERVLRRSGPWKQRALFAIDQGPMLLHLENARSGLIWELLARNPNFQRGWQRLYEREYTYLPLVQR